MFKCCLFKVPMEYVNQTQYQISSAKDRNKRTAIKFHAIIFTVSIFQFFHEKGRHHIETSSLKELMHHLY